MPLPPLASRLHRMKDNDHVFMPTDELLVKLYWPIRTCGDIPFRNFHSMCTTSPTRYLQFLKELEESDSRHDFLFWAFDVITAGRTRKVYDIQSHTLDNAAQHYMHDIQSTVRGAMKSCSEGSLSKYIITKYPYMFSKGFFKLMKQNEPFYLKTYHSDNEELWIYRKTQVEKLMHKCYRQCNYNPIFFVNPMENLTPDDFPKEQIKFKNIPELRYGPDDEYYLEYIESLKYEHDDHDLLPALFFRKEILTYTGMIPERDECILVNKNVYMQKQAEVIMKKIDPEKLLPLDYDEARNVAKDETIIVARVNNIDGNVVYKRAQILWDEKSTADDEVKVFCVDTGECPAILISNIFIYDFKDSAKLRSIRDYPVIDETEEEPKERVVTLAERVPRNELPEADLQINDFFLYDSALFTATRIPKYVYYGRPKKPENFFCQNNPFQRKTIKYSMDDF